MVKVEDVRGARRSTRGTGGEGGELLDVPCFSVAGVAFEMWVQGWEGKGKGEKEEERQ